MSEEKNQAELCPCGSKKPYDKCCGLYHTGEQHPATAEHLMRSRYSAFAKNDFDYLNRSTHESAEQYDTPHNRQLYSQFEWVGLEILSTEKGTIDDNEGYVDFVASYRVGGGDHTIREKSYFRKQGGRWLYFSGKSLQAPKKKDERVGRNDPCPCGSGKKYKKCCMN
ncbi:MAG: YchJ family metal-binding protein [Gammaproteobacteria bacterium]|nr:YchJ family metal-binding protein [Gammaproteobacteria bacterium]